jgi:predicted TIM-barrel enzyme
LTLVLDAGALLAVDRGDRATAALIEVARRDSRSVIVPAGVVAQIWRDGSRQARIARLLGARQVSVDALTDAVARAAGALCGAAGTADLVDASVVIAARRYDATVISSDRADLTRLDTALSVVDC